MISDPAGAALVREVARRVRLHRLVRRLTQQDLADRAGLSRSFISLFEKGEHGSTSLRWPASPAHSKSRSRSW